MRSPPLSRNGEVFRYCVSESKLSAQSIRFSITVGFETEVFEGKRDFFLDGFAEKLVVGVLEDEADVSGESGDAGFGGFHAVYSDAATDGFQQAVEVFDEGGFACAVLPHDGDEFAVFDGEARRL